MCSWSPSGEPRGMSGPCPANIQEHGPSPGPAPPPEPWAPVPAVQTPVLILLGEWWSGRASYKNEGWSTDNARIRFLVLTCMLWIFSACFYFIHGADRSDWGQTAKWSPQSKFTARWPPSHTSLVPDNHCVWRVLNNLIPQAVEAQRWSLSPRLHSKKGAETELGPSQRGSQQSCVPTQHATPPPADGYVCARVLSIGCTWKTPRELSTNTDAVKSWIASLQIQMLKS